ncbi:Agmatine coumaroyltransferase-1 [Triticum urartu]|uniref:Agmatine coumaroyltransferase-1 n=1 Tax=Triticum urartu TaxID=4572 RepID=M7ZSL5_TRIUA|nr:Agmatine coumaroyltransferase-1 [Triticum urartu]
MAAMPVALAPQMHIVSVQTGLPTRVVEPERTRLIAVATPPLSETVLQHRLRAVLYYRTDDAPWEEGIWVKESLGEVLCFFPEIAGRLRRGTSGSWGVKLNDAGVRFQQATVEVTMEDFLADQGRNEAALAPWINLSQFQGGGYAIGVSCTVLLSDPLSLARFLLTWARKHRDMKAQNNIVQRPMMQYMAYIQRPEICSKRVRSFPIDSVAADGTNAQTMLFRTPGGYETGDLRALAAACINRASNELRVDRPLRFTLIVAPRNSARGATTVETAVTADDLNKGDDGQNLEATVWDELGLEELTLRGVKPVHVSYRIVGGGDEGIVVMMPDGDGFLVAATVPK